MLGDAILLKKHKELFGTQGETIIDRTGQNLGDYVFDEFVKDGDRILWCSEWKSRFREDVDMGAVLSEAKTELLEKRVKAARDKGFELPDYGYAFAVKITESYVEIRWERVKIPKS
ncbi:MAG: hypothetical protein QXO76_12070 [Thermoproteota archaeon]